MMLRSTPLGDWPQISDTRRRSNAGMPTRRRGEVVPRGVGARGVISPDPTTETENASMRILIALALALAAVPATLPASTILVYVDESGAPVSVGNGHTLRDAVLNGLFDRGHIVFDPGEGAVEDVAWDTGQSSILARLADEGGAAIIVVARAVATETPRDKGRPTVAIEVRYVVLDASATRPVSAGAGVVHGSNAGKEDEQDWQAVAVGVGRDVAAAVDALAAQGARSQASH
jgi:hypothetical protein